MHRARTLAAARNEMILPIDELIFFGGVGSTTNHHKDMTRVWFQHLPTSVNHLSHEKYPGELIAIGDLILPGLLGIMISHSGETYQPTSIMRWDRGIFNGSLVIFYHTWKPRNRAVFLKLFVALPLLDRKLCNKIYGSLKFHGHPRIMYQYQILSKIEFG